MRCRGKITTWKDDQGYGFITPSGGGEPVFVHISAFSSRKRRPAGNQNVTYELAADAKGRARAQNVAFPGEGPPSAFSLGRRSVFPAIAVLFVSLVAASAYAGKLPVVVPGLYIAASIVAFAVYAFDKLAAVKGRWRTPENTLHVLALMGGWPGALTAQGMLRHKSKKLSFQVVFWASVVLNCAALIWLLMPEGSETLRYMFNMTTWLR